jgi:hypothetical protein
VRKYWDTGRILGELTLASGAASDSGVVSHLGATEESGFPLRIKLAGPTVAQIPQHFAAVSQWIARLQDASKAQLGYGYELIEVERNLRGLGRNTLPTHAVIPTIDDALKLVRKTTEARRSLSFSAAILVRFPDAAEDLRPWLAKRALGLLAYSEDVERIIAVLAWFEEHPRSGLYLRQLDIKGVDTKFIEQHREVLGSLLELVLPADAVAKDAKRFEERFGLLSKPIVVRYRLLDPALPSEVLSDVQAPVALLATAQPAVPLERVFITENEINGLAFPPVARSMVIFGLGYGLDILRELPWLVDLPLYYWGDIDTHGFAMLNQVRSYFPQAQSFLMDQKTLLASHALWSNEPKQQLGELPHLTSDELAVYNTLRDNALGTGVRLEQERIPFLEVMQAIAGIVG